MNPILGFGSPVVTACWAVALLTAIVWLVAQVLQRRPVTVTSFIVFFWFFLPILLQYPFTFSPLNAVFATGTDAFDAYRPFVDRAMVASLLGMTTFVIAYRLVPHRPRPFLPVRVVRYGLAGWSNSALIWLSAIGTIALFSVFVLEGLAGTEGIRNLVMSLPLLRPFFNVLATVLPELIALLLLYALERRRASLWLLLAVLLVTALASGSRYVAFSGVLTFLLTLGAHRSLRRAVSPRRVLLALPVILAALALVFYIGDVRSGQLNPLLTLAHFGSQLFYANNYSDLRDFAWVMAYWDGEWFWGRTQLAGLLGFIPSVLSTFRVEWGWGRVSTNITGLGSLEADNVHAGLRPGTFGESYFNFGFVGVALAGLLLGYLAVRLEAASRQAVESEPVHGRFETRLTLLAVFTTLGLATNLFISSGFFSIYVTLGLLLVLRIVRLVLRASLVGDAIQQDVGCRV